MSTPSPLPLPSERTLPGVPRRTVLLASGAATAMAVDPLPSARADTVPAAPEAGLADLILDQIGQLEPTFDPEVTAYTATAYRSLGTLTLRAITTGGATVTIDGREPDTSAHDRVAVDLRTGTNTIEVVVRTDGGSRTYTVTVTKVDTDARGRELVPVVAVTSPVGEADGHPLTAITDGDRDTWWHPAGPLTAGEAGEDGVTSFTLDIGEVRTVSRVAGHVLTKTKTWYPDEWRTYVGIDVSADGEEWTRAAGHATLRQDQDIVYWEFGNHYLARYVRVTLLAMDSDLDDTFGVQEMQVFALPAGVEPPARHEPPADGGQEHAFVPTEAEVNRAQELALHHGIIVGMWATSDGYAAGSLEGEEYTSLASPTAQFYDPDFRNTDFMAYNPQATWGIAKAPHGGNGIQDAGDPKEYLPEAMLPYASRYIDAQYGDEGGYSSSEVDAFARWYAFSKETYPQAVIHANQYDGSAWNQLENMRHYVLTAKPDLLSFDRYYWQGGGVFGSGGPQAWAATSTLLSTGIWRTQRQCALEGLTGDGSEPILFGQYLDTFDHNGSQSQKSIVTSLSLASGMKWLSLFRLEINRFDGGSLFDEDGAPLRAYWEVADNLSRARAMSPFLTALHHHWLAVRPGLHLEDGESVAGSAPTGYRMAHVDDSGEQLLAHGIADVTATNVGTANDGLPGDVTVGMFGPLPGLGDDALQRVFGTTKPTAFMLVNGLVANAKLSSTMKLTRYDDGQHWQTAQEVRVTVVPPAGAELRRVDPVTGRTSAVELTTTPVGANAGAGNGKGSQLEVSFTTRIGGGQCELYYWTTPGLVVEADPEVLEVPMDGSATVEVTVRNEGTERSPKLTVAPTAPEGWSVSPAGPTALGAIDPGKSASVSLTVANTSALGDTMIDLGLTVQKVAAPAAVAVRGLVTGEVVVPEVVAADSQEVDYENGAATNAVDGDPSTFWHTQWGSAQPGYPHWIVLDLGTSQEIGTLRYLPRQDAVVGFVKEYEVYVSDDPESFPADPTATGVLTSTSEEKVIGVLATGRYLKFQGLSAWDGKPFMVAAELDVQLR